MMLVCKGLRVVPVTIHMALRKAINALSASAIVEAGRITDAALRRYPAETACAPVLPDE